MNAKRRFKVSCVIVAATLTSMAHAAEVTDFRTYSATTTSLAGQGTNDPIVGDFTATADSSFVLGYLGTPAVLGANVGDKITFSFGVSFNDATAIANAGDNFRFALFDLNGEMQDSPTGASGGPNYPTAGTANTDNFRGYYFGVRNGSGTGSGGSIRERIAMLITGQNAFAATGDNLPTAPSLGPVGGDPVTLTSDMNGDGAGADYTGELTLTRTATSIDLSGFFIGTNNATGNVFMASDSSPETLPASFGAVGFLIGNALNVEQVLFTNINVDVIPFAPSQDADFDNDADVDGEDLLIFQRGLGITGPAATNAVGNADGDMDVDGDDLTVFRSEFGTPQATASAQAIPEPASLALGGVALAAAAAGIARRRRLNGAG